MSLLIKSTSSILDRCSALTVCSSSFMDCSSSREVVSSSLVDCNSSFMDCSSSLVEVSSSCEDCISSRVVCSSSRKPWISRSISRTLAVSAGVPKKAVRRFLFGGAATSLKIIITIPRSASGSSTSRTVISINCVPPLVPTLIFLTDTTSFCWTALWKALPRAKRRPSRAMAKIFRLALPTAGSRYLPVRALI